MKWLLNFLPRPFLIKLSLIFSPFIKAFYKCDRFTDPIDGSSYITFLPYGYDKLRPNALCPGTLSLERHRYLWLYLQRQTTFLEDQLNVLHVAPEQVFYTKFKQFKHWQYTTTDLHSPLADVKANICSLPFQDNNFDLILCNHVLEHISDDATAMKELYRVLKKGGTLIAQVPLNETAEVTFEDDSITDPIKRTKIFGQYDHVRVYGMDYYTRLAQAGFKAEGINFLQALSLEEQDCYALPKEEKIPVAIK